MVPVPSETRLVDRSLKTVRELLCGRPLELDPSRYACTDVKLTHLVGGLVRRFSESWKDSHARSDVATYRPYFLGEIETFLSDEGARRVGTGSDRLVSLNLMLIQLHHLLSLHSGSGDTGIRELIEPERFGVRRSMLDGEVESGFVDGLLRGTASRDGGVNATSSVRARYQDLGWLMEGAIAPAALPYFTDWLFERVFVLEVGPPDDDLSEEVARSTAEPEEEQEVGAGANPFAVRLRPSVEGGQSSIESLVAATSDRGVTATIRPARDQEEQEEAEATDASSAARDVISYLVGAAFGQWDVRIPAPERVLHGKFEDLPPGVLVDEPGHRLDIEQRLLAAAKVVLDEDVEEIVAEAMRELGYDSVRAYLRAGFFEDHLKRYSRSRRQAPIYWPLGVPSGRWTVWLYAPRLTRELLVEVVDLARAKAAPPTGLHAVGSDGSRRREAAVGLRSQSPAGGAVPGARDETLIFEVEGFLAEAERIVALGWVPNLDDGAVLCAAPLADLCPSWPDLQRYRQELKAGSYPWASAARWARDL
jgi:hypothetical protein